ncbi:MAG: oxygen-dependent coproporphyrinogen oxidase [Bacteriovoracaceae bacterium]
MLESTKKKFHLHVRALQDQITERLKQIDPSLILIEDPWTRKDHQGQNGGGGLTRVFSGNLIENAGVNTSLVFGEIDPLFAKNLGGDGTYMWAAGISLIIHPRNPKVPTVHANFRMIQHGEKFWFGGGADLTPFYPLEEDFRHFHGIWKKALGADYEPMKKTCDEYFVNFHRDGEMRGIGGFFFDHFKRGTVEEDQHFVQKMSEHFIDSYFPIVEKRKDETYSLLDEDFQLHRRGRYVEFNLLHDRGTLFGLKTNGRTDSILVSLPARCKFSYKYTPPEGSPQAKMMTYYRPQNWI